MKHPKTANKVLTDTAVHSRIEDQSSKPVSSGLFHSLHVVEAELLNSSEIDRAKVE